MINAAGAELLTRSEAIRLKAYKCPAGKWTIGRGHTEGVKEGDVITPAQERDLFIADMIEYERQVRFRLKREPNENQLAAFICLAFNIGVNGFATSSVLKAYERGDDAAASRAFGLWNKITVDGVKVISNGLVARRAAEAALFLRPPADAPIPLMPQEVAPEKPMTESTINRASVAAGGATLAAISESLSTTVSIKQSLGGLGDWIVPVLLVCVLALVGYIVWERYNQRKEGRA